jgi:hypothetical protein
VAFINNSHEDKKSFTEVKRLFSGFLNCNSLNLRLEFSFNSETEPSDKYKVLVSQTPVEIVSHTL